MFVAAGCVAAAVAGLMLSYARRKLDLEPHAEPALVTIADIGTAAYRRCRSACRGRCPANHQDRYRHWKKRYDGRDFQRFALNRTDLAAIRGLPKCVSISTS